MALSMSETKIQNQVPLSEPASTLNISWQVERTQQGVQEYSHGHSNYVVMCFVRLLNGLLALPAFTQM